MCAVGFGKPGDNLGNLNYMTWHEQVVSIKGLVVYNTETDRTENL
jgi:hypothetical protein